MYILIFMKSRELNIKIDCHSHRVSRPRRRPPSPQSVLLPAALTLALAVAGFLPSTAVGPINIKIERRRMRFPHQEGVVGDLTALHRRDLPRTLKSRPSQKNDASSPSKLPASAYKSEFNKKASRIGHPRCNYHLIGCKYCITCRWVS
ncbi:hypothetical protein RHGRI_022684 [Rhododendron griersonianum]|uniref:Uncharacterized protein n=1 Tax=Rhododendron griersonianum TaxID=479676 RepID=A0AAV6J0Q2_9ERIC|nr:hypothetical protein RHGRI_022684 [Rhododendron griersonianum]